MKWGWMILMVFGVAFSATLTMADEPVALKNCRAEVDRLEKKVKGIEKDLSTLKERIKKQGKKIAKSQSIENKWGKSIDATRDEIRKLKKKLTDRIRKAGGYVGTGRQTSLDKIGHILMGGDQRATALQKEIKEKESKEKELIRKAEKEVDKEFGEILDFVDWRSDLTALKVTQTQDKNIKRIKKAELERKIAELANKRRECQLLAQNTTGKNTGQILPDNGVVTFIGGMQIPTPKSGMDLLIEDESGPNFEGSLAYLPLLQISYNDPRTKAYYDALKTDFKAVFGTKKGEKMPPTSSLFSKSGAEYSALFLDSQQAG